MNYLLSVANKLMSIGRLLADGESQYNFDEKFSWVEDLLEAINVILFPLLIVVGAAGTIYAVVIGVNMARADSTEKREEAKKRLINVLVGLAIVVGLILFIRLLIAPNGILVNMLDLGKKPTP